MPFHGRASSYHCRSCLHPLSLRKTTVRIWNIALNRISPPFRFGEASLILPFPPSQASVRPHVCSLFSDIISLSPAVRVEDILPSPSPLSWLLGRGDGVSSLLGFGVPAHEFCVTGLLSFLGSSSAPMACWPFFLRRRRPRSRADTSPFFLPPVLSRPWGRVNGSSWLALIASVCAPLVSPCWLPFYGHRSHVPCGPYVFVFSFPPLSSKPMTKEETGRQVRRSGPLPGRIQASRLGPFTSSVSSSPSKC